LPLACLGSILSGYFTACGKIGRLVAVDFLERAVSIVLTVAALVTWAGDDVEKACCAILGGSAAAAAVSLLCLLVLFLHDCRHLGPVPRDLHMGQRLGKLCLPLAANDYLRTGLSTAEHLLIPRGLRQSGSSYEQSMAAYGTIHGMVFPILMFPAAVLYAVSDLLVPELARSRAAGWQQRIASLTDHCLRFGLLFAAVVTGLLYLLADGLGQLFYHSADAGLYLRQFAPLVLILYMDAIVDGMHKGLGQQVQCMRYNTFTSLLDVALLLVLLPRYGVGGYFASFTITHAVNFYLSIARLLKVTGYTPALCFLGKVTVCCVAAIVTAGWFAPWCATLAAVPALLAQAAIFLLLFAALCALLTVLSRQDLRWLRGVVRP
jgi:stage V sporulation protein B